MEEEDGERTPEEEEWVWIDHPQTEQLPLGDHVRSDDASQSSGFSAWINYIARPILSRKRRREDEDVLQTETGTISSETKNVVQNNPEDNGLKEPEVTQSFWQLGASIDLSPISTLVAITKNFQKPKVTTGIPSCDISFLRQVTQRIQAFDSTTASTLLSKTYFIPFRLTHESAYDAFMHWTSNLWFAPPDLTRMMDRLKITPWFVPFYLISTKTLSKYKGTVGSIEGTKDNVVLEGQVESIYSDLLISGMVESIADPEFSKLLEGIGDWSFSRESGVRCALLDLADVDEQGEGEKESKQSTRWIQEDVRVIEADRPDEIWKNIVMREIRGKEQEKCKAQYLTQARERTATSAAVSTPDAHLARRFSFCSLSYSDSNFQILYLPLFLVEFMYDETRYRLAINGQTGKAFGIRPYGLGKVLGGGVHFLENIFELGPLEERSIGLVEGSALRKLDRCTYYPLEIIFLVFPPTRSYVVTYATGWVKLCNSGATNLELKSRQRLGAAVVGSYTLTAGETKTFDYRGAWCIELHGTLDAIKALHVLDCQSSGGGNNSNDLGMCY